MKAELICIGTELLLGDIINTNASFIGQELASIGIPLYYVTTVGDNKERIIKAFEIADKRADIIITSGGLGPTEDDLTHECVANFLGVELDFHEDIANALSEYFKSRGRELSKSNLKQAQLPSGSNILPNPHGTAPGIIYTQNNKCIITFPGVPKELYKMWEETAKPFLIKYDNSGNIIKSKVLRFYGHGESFLAEQVADLLKLENPTVAPLLGKGDVTLRVTARAKNHEEIEKLINPVKTDIIKRLQEYYYGSDNDTLSSVIGDLLLERRETLSIAESCTGGTVSQLIVSNPKVSEYYKFGLVCYTEEMKIKELGVNPETIKKYGLVSPEVTLEMSEKIREKSNTTWGISTTGYTETNIDSEKEKLGTVYIAVSSKDNTEVRKVYYPKFQRENIMFFGAQSLLNLLRLTILKSN